MRGKTLKFCILLAFLQLNAYAQNISTLAGSGTSGYSGDGGLATSANLNSPKGVTVDGAGNVYIADWANSRVRKVTPTGVISTIAGTGVAGYSGDGGAATLAQLNNPRAVAIDDTGNLYISDTWNHRIRKVNLLGTISTYAGIGGTGGYTGDGVPATTSSLNDPIGITFDGSGNLYIADCQNMRIRKVAPWGTISTIAGNGTMGFSGDGGAGISAMLNSPYGVAVDVSGNVYIADAGNNRVRRVSFSGIISTIAGNGVAGYSGDGGIDTFSILNNPQGIAVDPVGNVYISDSYNSRVRKISTSNIINTVAGNGTAGYLGDGGPATVAEINRPGGLAINGGNIYIADDLNNRVRFVGCLPIPNAGSIVGIDSICPGDTATFTDSVSGGIWISRSSAVATITSAGLVTGLASGTDTIEYVVSNPCGTDTAFIPVVVKPLTLCPSTGTISVQRIELPTMNIYPNPSYGESTVIIKSEENMTAEVAISDVIGKEITKFKLETNTVDKIQLSVPSGIYIVVARTRSYCITRKIIVK